MAKPHGRSLADFLPISHAEAVVLRSCRMGVSCHVGRKRPNAPERANSIRAEFLRFLALGGDDVAPVHENGVELEGAWISGSLNLAGVFVPGALVLKQCRFEAPIVLRGATLQGGLELTGSYCPGIKGDGLICHGDLLLRDGFTSDAEIKFIGANVAGDVDLSGAQLSSKAAQTLRLDSATVKGGLYLRDGFAAEGCVSLIGLHVIRDLDLENSQFKGRQRGERTDEALTLRRGRVDGALIVKGTCLYDVSLEDAHVRYLRDEAGAWGERIKLNGFVYDTIAHESPTGAAERLAWLRRQAPEQLGEAVSKSCFCPQPWQHLIKTLRTMGHSEDAQAIGIAYQDQLRRVRKVEGRDKNFRARATRLVAGPVHWMFWLFAGYGYRPVRLFYWMFAVWIVGGSVYWFAALQGSFGPSNPLIFESKNYKSCLARKQPSIKNWYLCPDLKSEYSTFSPFAYSLDVLLPVVDLHQEDSWAPLIDTPQATAWLEATTWRSGHLLRMFIWFQTLFGWASSLLLIATATGFARRAEEPN